MHGYADPYDPFGLFSQMSPCHGDGSLHPAFYQHTRFSTLLSITCSSLYKLSSVRHHPALLLLCLLLFRFTALMWSNYCWLWAPLFTALPCFVQETVWIYVFHCSTLRPSPWASHLNETDVSDTTTHTCRHTHKPTNQWTVVCIYMAFACISPAKREPAIDRNKIEKERLLAAAGDTHETELAILSTY